MRFSNSVRSVQIYLVGLSLKRFSELKENKKTKKKTKENKKENKRKQRQASKRSKNKKRVAENSATI
jgi:hypothetical protein